MRSNSRHRAPLVALLCSVLAAAGCGRAEGPPRIAIGTPCSACGMETRDLRWSAARIKDGRVRAYDSIECALKDGAASDAPGGSVLYVADFATGALHRADSLTVVCADIPSPMGGGFAAFLEPSEAERVAAERNGRAGRLADVATGGPASADAARPEHLP